MPEETVRITRRHREWQAWAGSTADLDKIVQLMQKLMDERRNTLIAAYEQEHPRPEPVEEPAPAEDTTGEKRYEYYRYREELAVLKRGVEAIRSDTGLRVSLTDLHSDETIGESSVLTELDRRTWQIVKLSGQFPYSRQSERLEIKMERNTPLAGLSLVVTSEDPGWAKQALAVLSEEIDHGSPWWRFFRTRRGSAVLGGVVGLLTLTTVTLLLKLVDWKQGVESATAIAAGVVVVSALGISEGIRPWMFPPVEIVNEGEKPKGSRVIPFIATLVFTSLVGIAINTIH